MEAATNGRLRRLLSARVVLLCGVSGSGKTALAHRLERKGFTRLSVDGMIWQRYGDAFPRLSDEERSRIFLRFNGEVLDQALCRLLDQGRRVVVDATLCRRAKRDHLRQLLRSHGVEPVLVYLQAPADELRRRLARRSGSGPDDQRVSPRQLAGYLANFEPPAPSDCL